MGSIKINHPGQISSGLSREQEKFLSFEQFVPFISQVEADPIIVSPLIASLKEIFQKTQRLWRPELCVDSLRLAQEARRITPNYFPKDTKVIVRIYHNVHIWIVIQPPHEKELVVDPAGIMDGRFGKILPFFGDAGNCTIAGHRRLFARWVYSKGEELTESQETNLFKYLDCFDK